MPTKSTPGTPVTIRRGEARVWLQNASRSRSVPASARFRAWVRAAASGRIEVTIRLVGAREGSRLNLAYRGKDHATNVLAFAYDPPPQPPRAARGASSSAARGAASGAASGAAAQPAQPTQLRGDIVLCPTVVAREARAQGKPLSAHYAHLTVHAVLHLRGYDHARPADAARMERAEIRVLRRLGLPNPYLT